MKKIILLFLLFPLSFCNIFSQNCTNSDFSHLNFSHWAGYIGNSDWCCPIPGIWPGRQTIINTPMVDPRTCGGLTVPPPGYTVCARLGDPATQGEAEQLIYELTVDPANPIFFYTFAVVLAEPNIQTLNKPHFSVRLLDSAYTWIDTVCGLYQIYSDSTAPGYQYCDLPNGVHVNWLDWTLGSINLSSLTGHRLRIVFTTYDCTCPNTAPPYFASAYFTARCGSLEIEQSICAGNNGTLNLTAPPGFYYYWSTGEITQTISITNPLFGSTYTCQLTGATGCDYSLSTTVGLNMFTIISPGFTYSHESCSRYISFDNTSTVNTGSPFTQYWDFGDGTNSTVLNPRHTFPASGQYNVSLTISTTGGCDSTIVQTIDISDLPQAAFTAEDTCQPTGIPFHNFSSAQNGISSWKWDFGDGSPPDILNWESIHNYVNPGPYWVTLWVTDSVGCTDSITHNVFSYASLLARFDKSLLNCNDSTTTITFSGSSLTTTSIYWDFGGGIVVSGTGIGPYVIKWPHTADYIVSLILDGPFCDTSSFSDTIPFHGVPASSFTLSQNPCCLNDSLHVQYTGNASSFASYTWSFGGAAYVNGSGQGPYSIFWPSIGDYIITLIIDDNNCISSEGMLKVKVEKVEADIISSQDALCYGSNSGSAISSGSGGIPPYSFVWSNAAISTENDSIIAGFYTVTVTDSAGCSGTDTVSIFSPLPYNVEATTLNSSCKYLCDGELSITVAGGTLPYAYLWNTTPAQSTSSITNLCPGTYALMLSDDHNCDSVISFQLLFNTDIHSSGLSDKTSGPVPLPVNFTFTGYGANSILWDFGDGTTSDVINPFHIFTEVGDYQVFVIINSLAPDSCADTSRLTIIVEDTSFVEVPNVFTPNNDGFNDNFNIKKNYLENCSITVFNRWGTVVYKFNGQDISWDGKTIDGNPAQQGTYYYSLEATGKDMRNYKKQGAVMLLR